LRDDPIKLEHALSYELTGRGSSEEAIRILGGQQPRSAEETVWLCKKDRGDATYFTEDVAQEPAAPTQKGKPMRRLACPTNVSKASVFGGLSRRPVQAELEFGIPTPRGARQGRTARIRAQAMWMQFIWIAKNSTSLRPAASHSCRLSAIAYRE